MFENIFFYDEERLVEDVRRKHMVVYYTDLVIFSTLTETLGFTILVISGAVFLKSVAII